MEIFEKSFIDTIKDITQITPQEVSLKLEEGYISSIKLGENTLVYVMANKEFLTLLSDILLFDNNPNEDTLNDLIGELANLIVGRAKVLFEEEGKNFTISPPMPCVKNTTIQYDKDRHFCINNACCSIFIKGVTDL
ncbi:MULTISPECIES: chemotaxis protein CheX [unclassified Helicobacter]|uniref:chemotaxis protein CheX n=1 Tax=unclassified Helicobacter TaxID=2593540 RepID=UPI000CF0D7B7|nr:MULTISPECIES: chemotaxis protein CheX [unclassified Helicobacter]